MMVRVQPARLPDCGRLPRACVTVFLLLYSSIAGAEPLPLARIDRWESHSFEGETRFDWQMRRNCLVMASDGTASVRYYEREFELSPATRLAWRWREIDGIRGVDQSSVKGDDFSGRIYVAVRDPILFWQSRVLAYVHATEFPVDTHWPNPSNDQFHVWVASNGTEGDWHSIERRLQDDWESAFGDRPDSIDAIGLMADSDNTGQSTELCLRDLAVTR